MHPNLGFEGFPYEIFGLTLKILDSHFLKIISFMMTLLKYIKVIGIVFLKTLTTKEIQIVSPDWRVLGKYTCNKEGIYLAKNILITTIYILNSTYSTTEDKTSTGAAEADKYFSREEQVGSKASCWEYFFDLFDI